MSPEAFPLLDRSLVPRKSGWVELYGDEAASRPGKTMAATREKACFISAPFGFNVFPLMQALAERGVASSRLDDLEPGEDITARIRREIGRVGFVCVVLPSGYRESNVLFETGLALGKGRP